MINFKNAQMNTEELYAEIMKTIMTIQEKYPELAENLGEMPITIPGVKDPEINMKNLRSFNESLRSLLENYISGHPGNEAP